MLLLRGMGLGRTDLFVIACLGGNVFEHIPVYLLWSFFALLPLMAVIIIVIVKFNVGE